MINSPGPTNLADIRNLDLVATVRSGRVLMAGAGASGRGAIAVLKDVGCLEVVIVDDSALGALVAADSSVRHVTTTDAHGELADVVAIVTSSGRRPASPLFGAAAEAGAPVFGDVALAFAGDYAQLWGPERTWLAITGANGKATTTPMLAAILGGQNAVMGNIGVALYDVLTAEPRIEVSAAELSSFQPHWAPSVRPDAGVLLSLTEDHIDWRGSYENYSTDKTRALHDAIAIYGACDANVAKHVGRMRENDELSSFVVGFIDGPPEAHQVRVRDGIIVDHAFGGGGAAANDSEPGIIIASIAEISPPGRAGVLDAMAATVIVRNIGASPEQIAATLEIFEVHARRDQTVHKASDVMWIDDSKATNPHATDATLPSHKCIVWIVGGQLKGAEISPLMTKHAHRLQVAVILGVNRQLVNDALSRVIPAMSVVVINNTDRADAMAKIYMAANEYANPGDVVLLAPTAASLDMYSGMAEHGDLFV